MIVRIFANDAIAFDDYGRCAKIEGAMFRILLKQYLYRKEISPKTDRVIIREIVEGWPAGWLDWMELKNANR